LDSKRWGSPDQFYDLLGDVLTFERSENAMQVTLEMNGEKYFAGKMLAEVSLDQAALEAFTGDYKGSEVDGAIQVSVEHGDLILRSGSNAPLRLTPINKSEFVAGGSFFVDFTRDEHGRVTGLSISEHAARGIRFVRSN
jgi:hypothetical protein